MGGAPCRTRAPHEGTGCIVRAQRNGGMAAVKRAEKSDLEAVFKKVNTTIVEGGEEEFSSALSRASTSLHGHKSMNFDHRISPRNTVMFKH